MVKKREVIRIDRKDNVLIALKDLRKGMRLSIEGEEILLKESIPRGHKISLRKIAKGELIIKYGAPIGRAIREIKDGEHVHIHNMKGIKGR